MSYSELLYDVPKDYLNIRVNSVKADTTITADTLTVNTLDIENDVEVKGDLTVEQDIHLTGTINNIDTTDICLLGGRVGGQNIIGSQTVDGSLRLTANIHDFNSGQVEVLNTNDATTQNSAAFQVRGGIWCDKKINNTGARGDLLVGNQTGTSMERLPVGTVNQFLRSTGTHCEWAAAGINQYVFLFDQKATTVAGGASTAATWVTRDLNTKVDPFNLVTLNANEFRPVNGTYICSITSPVYETHGAQARLRDVDNDIVVLLSGSMYESSTGGSTTLCQGQGVIQCDGVSSFRLEQWCQNTVSTNGFGVPSSSGEPEIYSRISLFKIA